MPITGAHAILYTPEAEAVRAFFKDVLGYDHIDAGGGWLIFALPPADIGVHPSDGSTHHEFSFQCDDIAQTMAELEAKGVEFTGPPEDHGYGPHTNMKLPGGVAVQLYEPSHERLF
jgi:catechol 2,3-dioxygenase-like lactoylglutathione lyase family enzyme